MPYAVSARPWLSWGQIMPHPEVVEVRPDAIQLSFWLKVEGPTTSSYGRHAIWVEADKLTCELTRYFASPEQWLRETLHYQPPSATTSSARRTNALRNLEIKI